MAARYADGALSHVATSDCLFKRVAAHHVAKAALGRSACTPLKSFPVLVLNPTDSFFNLTLVAIMLD